MSAAVPLHDVSPPRPNLTEAQRALEIFADTPDQVTEVRALDVSTPNRRQPHTVHGFFANRELAARGGCRVASQARGVYFMPNPVNAELLRRSSDRMQDAKSGMATSNTDIVVRNWFIVDCDPTRPSGTAATDAEKATAHDLMEAVYHYLVRVLGWPEPVLIDSGNGFYLLFRVALPTQDGGLIKRCLMALAAGKDTSDAHIDTGMDNPARLIRLPGTPNCKGPNTPDRPWRLARLCLVPETINVVPTAHLGALAVHAPKEPERPPIHAVPDGAPLDIEAFIQRNGLHIEGPTEWQGGRKYIFPVCPFNPAHDNKSAVLIQHGSGAVSFTCHHNGCKNNDWHALRAHYAPPPIPLRQYRETEEENNRLKAENAELRTDRDRLAALVADLHRKIDLLEVSGDSPASEELEEKVVRLTEEKRQIMAIVLDRTLAPIERVVGIRAMDKGNAYRQHATVGDAVEPPKEQRIWAGEIEAETGIGRGTFARYIKEVMTSGHVTYRIEPDPKGAENGRPRSIGWISAGDGQTHAKVDLRRKRDAAAKAREREKQEREAEKNRKRVAELEKAAERAAQGCPFCGDRLLATGFHCAGCHSLHTVETIAATALIDDSSINPSPLACGDSFDESSRNPKQRPDEEFIDESSINPEQDSQGGFFDAASENTIYRFSDESSENHPTHSAPPIGNTAPPLRTEPRPDWPCAECGHGGWSKAGSTHWYCSRCNGGYLLDDEPETGAS